MANFVVVDISNRIRSALNNNPGTRDDRDVRAYDTLKAVFVYHSIVVELAAFIVAWLVPFFPMAIVSKASQI